jgi:hypothetical protein
MVWGGSTAGGRGNERMPSEEEDQNVLLIYVQRQHDENLKYTERG